MTVRLEKTHGFIGLVGPTIDHLAASAIQSASSFLKPESFEALLHYHVTVITKTELQNLSPEKISISRLREVDTSRIFSCGIGGSRTEGVYFVVIIWAAGQNLRRGLGLPPKHFHITLSTQDDHGMEKGLDSLVSEQFPESPNIDFFDHLSFTLHVFGEYYTALSRAIELIRAFPYSHRGFIRLADAGLQLEQYKLAMLSYACAFSCTQDQKARDYCLKVLVECSKSTEWGAICDDSEVAQIPSEVSSYLFRPWPQELRHALSETTLTPTLRLEARHPLHLATMSPSGPSFYKLPRFFRWLVPYHIALMSTPRSADDVTKLASPELGIRHILTLTEETPLPSSWFLGKPISNTFLPIPNYHPPSIEQMDIVMRMVEDSEKLPLLIHCGGGKGRAGTVAACYLAAYGFSKPKANQERPEMAATEAIAALRSLRPGSLETSQQEAFVQRWCSTIWKRQSIYPDFPSEPPPCWPQLEGKDVQSAQLYVLCGLPGSGKSWFSKALLARDPSGWTRVSQDESGSRAACETEVGRAPNGRMLLDRCNTSSDERRLWLSLASNWATNKAICIWFDYSPELCESRAQRRAGHPTLPPGSRVRNAVDQMRRMFSPPTLKEGFVGIIAIRSFEASQDLVNKLSPVYLFKFPRTAHIFDLGAVRSDDIVLDATLTSSAGNVVITEKVDGANMGFSLSPKREIVVQNRSHYVNPSTHEQFKKLGLWLDVHSDDLRKVLDRDPIFPERYILFGEWLYATHSIPYTHLPDRFMAFDLYDRSMSLFVDRHTVASILEPTSIQLVPVLYEGKLMPSSTELKAMVQQQSAFWDGRVEGVYVKVEREGRVVSRGKVVRGDFIAGNEHWSKGVYQKGTENPKKKGGRG